jgi:TetR/AcrR family transcriptional regulator
MWVKIQIFEKRGIFHLKNKPTSEESGKLSAEQKILDVARKHFYEKGYAGARMQEIADDTGINKAMLHYYFSTKDKLFEAIFLEALQEMLPVMVNALIEEDVFEKRIKKLISAHIDLYLKNPFIPGFIIHEMNRDPEHLFNIVFNRKGIEKGTVQAVLARILQEEQGKGHIKKVDPRQFIMDIYALTAFPFMARTLFSSMFAIEGAGLEGLMEERKKHVTILLIASLKI